MTKKELGPLEGTQVQFFPTEVCNRLSCDHCPLAGKSKGEIEELRSGEISSAEWGGITDYLHKQGVRLFTILGGEPASREDIPEIINNITKHEDSFVLFSTSGLHLREDKELREKVGKALSNPPEREFKNGIAISFDKIPSETPKDSREKKALEGLELVKLMQSEFPNIDFVANVMVTPENLSDLLKIQDYLESFHIKANFCTQQGKCFGKKDAVFSKDNMSELTEVAIELIKRKVDPKHGKYIAPSAAYLSQLPGIVGLEQYRCSKEHKGNPVLDIDSKGCLDFCFWLKQGNFEKQSFNMKSFMSGEMTWKQFQELSKRETKDCECSWSRRDRERGMVSFNKDILKMLKKIGINFDPDNVKYQNHWVQAQESVFFVQSPRVNL